MSYKDFNLGDWIGHISGAIEDERELDGNEMRDLAEFLSKLPKWIPVNERLPEECKEVLTCSLGGFIEIQSINHGYWENQYGDWSDIDEVYIVAWMPLPSPYQAESEDK